MLCRPASLVLKFQQRSPGVRLYIRSVPGTDEWGILWLVTNHSMFLTACRPSNSVIWRFIGRVECCGTVLKSPLLVDAAAAAIA